MSYVYILQNDAGSYYIGYSTDLERRVAEHKSDRGGWTSDRGPWTLCYYEQYESDHEARRRELQLKKAKNKNYLKWLTEHGPGTPVD